MKKAAFIICTIVTHCVFGEPSSRLIDALMHVESKGKVHAIGDNGRAVGCLQIHKVVIEDVNRAYNTSYKYSDRKSIEKSREICRRYLILHGGRNATDEKYARIWNGGPKGHRKVATRKYWGKV
jgi:hypothetical protein